VTIDDAAPPLDGRAIIEQRWSTALFLHWRIEPAAIADRLPPGTYPDLFDGSAWVGLIPFVLGDFRFLPLPPVPVVGSFVEINVRTYAVDEHGRRGVVFLTLEAEHLLPVLGARTLFGLPYRWARAGLRVDERAIEYRSRRHGPGPRPRTRIRVAPGASPVDTDLSRFLTARWGFLQSHLGRTIWAANEHEPWPLVDGELIALDDELLGDSGFPDLAARPPDSVLAMRSQHPGFLTRFGAPVRI
jgi:uncharacterized protein YqjF (DUF2071 family)